MLKQGLQIERPSVLKQQSATLNRRFHCNRCRVYTNCWILRIHLALRSGRRIVKRLPYNKPHSIATMTIIHFYHPVIASPILIAHTDCRSSMRPGNALVEVSAVHFRDSPRPHTFCAMTMSGPQLIRPRLTIGLFPEHVADSITCKVLSTSSFLKMLTSTWAHISHISTSS